LKDEAGRFDQYEERSDFFLTYVECIAGLLRNDKHKHFELVKEISTDETRDEKLREYVNHAIKNYYNPSYQ